jgi:uncharacterized oxidoreductase
MGMYCSRMPNIDATRLEATGTRIFAAMGAPAADAAWISMLLVRANLRGHDSHGVIRIPQYWTSVRDGIVDPKSPVTVTMETPVMARLDGGRGFGQPVARRGMEMAIAKAKAAGLSAVTLANTSHVGRLADYAEMAAREGLIGMLWVNAVHGLNVAPWGGAARRLGTNPHAIAVPGPDGPAMVLDFATSVVAEGKMRVKKNRKQQAPPGWFLDPGGRPHTDPEVFYGDPPGSLLAAGDHKGYGLSLAVEILGGIVSGTGPAGPGKGIFANGTLMICLDTTRFLPPADFDKQVAALFEWVKSAPLAQGATEILIPGEPEARLEAERRRDGIPVEDETWSQIQSAAKDLASHHEGGRRHAGRGHAPTRSLPRRIASVNRHSEFRGEPDHVDSPGAAHDLDSRTWARCDRPGPPAGARAGTAGSGAAGAAVRSVGAGAARLLDRVPARDHHPGSLREPNQWPAIHRPDAPRLRHWRAATRRDPRRGPPARRPAPGTLRRPRC